MYQMFCEAAGAYNVCLAPGLLDFNNGILAGAIRGRRALVVVDPTVEKIYGERLRSYLVRLSGPVAVHVASCTEETKTVGSVLEICAAAQSHELGRRDLLVAFGGGVCCDIVTVAASLIRRGIPYVCLPTTLVAQIDAGIGLKGGVNFRGSKNYLGSFTPPELVLVDPSLLRTVSVPDLRAGLAEMIKIGIVLDSDLFQQIGQLGPELIISGFDKPVGTGSALIIHSARLMLDQLALDCYEIAQLERLVDFGHTFSGKLEELSEFRLRHGEAVAIDMAVTCSIGVELSLFSRPELGSVLHTLRALGLPVDSRWCTPENLTAALADAAAHRDGALNLVVPTAIGAATFVRDKRDISTRVLSDALRRIERWGRRTSPEQLR